MGIPEITADALNAEEFIRTSCQEISAAVGKGLAINALSGGVDSSTVTMLGHKALGNKLKTYFIDNALMREGEPESVVATFKKLGVPVERIDARDDFLYALRGITDPEAKREAITQTFYKKVFGKLVRDSGAQHLLQGTILTDIEETVAGVKRQHNVLAQLGIDTQKEFGYQVLEPLLRLRKPAVRKLGRALGLPASVFDRRPFPGPALAARILGEVTAEELWIVRRATRIVEEELTNTQAFQFFAILHEDKVTGMRGGKRDFGRQLEIRCWDTKDAVTATPTALPWAVLQKLATRLTTELTEVVSVTYNVTPKPPSTMEAV